MMMPLRTGVLVLLAMLLVVTSRADAQQVWSFGDVEVRDQTIAHTEVNYGYLTHRFVLVNHSSTRTHRVTLEAPASSYSSGGHALAGVTRTFELPPNSRSMVTIPHPSVPLTGSGFRVLINGQPQRDRVRSRAAVTGSTGYYGSPFGGMRFGGQAPVDELYVLASPQAMSVPSVSEQSRNDEFHFRRHPQGLGQWDREWLNYSAWAAVVFTADEWESAPGELRQTLLDYVRAGGVLAILADFILDDLDWPEGAVADTERTAHLGFGRVIHLDADELAYELDRAPWSLLADEARDTHRSLSQRASIMDGHRRFELIDDIEVPIRALFALLVVFALVAGPVNLVVVTRKQRRTWLLWTTPLISLVFCTSVVAYTLLADGITPTTRVGTITLLDQQAQRAATVGWLGYYAPLAPRQGLRFDNRTELTAQFDAFHDQPGRSRTFTWEGDRQHLRSGWVAAGVPSHFRVRQAGPERRRLQLVLDDEGNLAVANHLDGFIVQLDLVDGDGSRYVAHDLAPGEQGRLYRTENLAEAPPPQPLAARLRDGVFRSDWRPPTSADDAVIERVREALSGGSYLAIVEGSPFVDPDLPRHHRREQISAVIGMLGEADLSVAQGLARLNADVEVRP